MMHAFSEDCARYSGRRDMSLWRRLRLVLSYPGLQVLFVYRLGRASANHPSALLRTLGLALHRMLHAMAAWAYDMRLELSADIGPGFYIGHLGNIHVAHCRIGENCSVGQSSHVVGLGDIEPAVLGDRVWFGPHATLKGHFQVGSDSTVSAGALVNRDLPAGALCLGVPVRVVLMGYDNSAFLALPKAEGSGGV